ncbi:unnamed protein product [Merluccius merluccius]
MFPGRYPELRMRRVTPKMKRSSCCWQSRYRKEVCSFSRVCRVVRNTVPPTFSRTHFPLFPPVGLIPEPSPPAVPPCGATAAPPPDPAAAAAAGAPP